jgi:hypothetical protein
MKLVHSILFHPHFDAVEHLIKFVAIHFFRVFSKEIRHGCRSWRSLYRFAGDLFLSNDCESKKRFQGISADTENGSDKIKPTIDEVKSGENPAPGQILHWCFIFKISRFFA